MDMLLKKMNTMKKLFISLTIALVCLFQTKATTCNVSSIASLQSTINTAVAGDIIILANGTYTNASFTIGTSGTNINDITVTAATSGSVIFNGTSTCSITGNNDTFTGFQYKNGDIGSTLNSIEIFGNFNTVSQCNFYGYRAHNYLHVNVGSQHSQITYCNFEAKAPNHNDGASIEVTISQIAIFYTYYIMHFYE